MKILRVSSELYPYAEGGIALHVHDLTRDLLNIVDETTIFTCKSEEMEKVQSDLPVNIVDFGRKISLCGNTICINMLPLLLKNRYSYDLIHAHSHLFFNTFLCAIVRKIGSSPLIITNHGFQSQSAPMWLQKLYLPTVGKWILNSADIVLCYTDDAKMEIVGAGVKENKIKVVPFGIDMNAFSPRNDTAAKKNGLFSVLWVGRLAPRKGLKYMLLGFKEFHDNNPKSELLIAGSGEYYNPIAEWIANNNLDDCIHLLGKVDYADMPKYYTEADVFCMTSMYEAGPRTMLEAMACECPVISTDLDHLKPIIPLCGVMVPTRDYHAIATGLEKIMKNSDIAKELGRRGREIIVEKYSWGALVSLVYSVYCDLLHR